ncbi:MAG: DUF5615 family PIN-like protein [Ktedonobacterales bacterium]
MSGPANENVRYLTDENFDPAIVRELRRKQPRVDIITAVEAGTLRFKDPALLAFAAQDLRIIVSHDKRTLPDHLANFLVAGHHRPGVMRVPVELSIGKAIETLLFVWEASTALDW